MKPIRQWSKPWQIVGVLIVGYFLIATPVLLYLYKRVGVVKQGFRGYSDQLVASNYHSAYEMTGSDFKMAISEPDFTAQQKLLCSRYGQLMKVDIGSTEVEGNEFGWSSTIKTQFEYEHSKQEFDVVMRRYDGRWQLKGYEQR